jgi:hypothetical protein
VVEKEGRGKAGPGAEHAIGRTTSSGEKFGKSIENAVWLDDK